MRNPKKEQSLSQDRITEEVWAVQTVMIRRANRRFTPPTDVIEFPDRLVVLIEIAGMRTEDFQITLLNRNLIVNGFRNRPPFDNPAYHQVEIGFGEFRVEIGLPWPVQQDEVNASYGEGFLQIDLPRLGTEHIHVTTADNEEQE
jgi:HSP20 family protein